MRRALLPRLCHRLLVELARAGALRGDRPADPLPSDELDGLAPHGLLHEVCQPGASASSRLPEYLTGIWLYAHALARGLDAHHAFRHTDMAKRGADFENEFKAAAAGARLQGCSGDPASSCSSEKAGLVLKATAGNPK
jgi:hypothetical protein